MEMKRTEKTRKSGERQLSLFYLSYSSSKTHAHKPTHEAAPPLRLDCSSPGLRSAKRGFSRGGGACTRAGSERAIAMGLRECDLTLLANQVC